MTDRDQIAIAERVVVEDGQNRVRNQDEASREIAVTKFVLGQKTENLMIVQKRVQKTKNMMFKL
jgi:hypothetical protein